MTPIILIYDGEDPERGEIYQQYMQSLLPQYDVRTYHKDNHKQISDHTDHVHYIACTYIESDIILQFTHLKAIISLWAGVNYLIKQENWPQNIPLYRMIDESLTAGMREYVIAHILYYDNNIAQSINAQKFKLWQPYMPDLAKNKTVGILGAGVLGSDVGQHLANLGFKIKCWTRSQKQYDFADCYDGIDNLETFLNDCDYLVNLLPATQDTYEIINQNTLSMLPQGAVIINSGRGDTINDADLINAIDDGHIKGASLDVFHKEPLPDDHPFWSHPNIIITPHIASKTRPDTSSDYIANVITKLDNGENITDGLVDFKRGY